MTHTITSSIPQNTRWQVKTKVPTVAIDKTDGIVVILPRGSLDTTFTTSKSSEMCVLCFLDMQ